MITRLLLLGILLVPTLSSADERVLDALAASAGTWEGQLYYLDYQSGQRFGIPMQSKIDVTPDGATVIYRITWVDPGNVVYAVVLTTIDADTGELVQAFFRDGKGEYMRYDVVNPEIESETKWSVAFEHDGIDDNRPARIRTISARDGDTMSSVKEVRFLDEDSGEWFERNGSDLVLLDAEDTGE